MWEIILKKKKLPLVKNKELKELMQDRKWRTTADILEALDLDISYRHVITGKLFKSSPSGYPRYEKRKKEIAVERPSGLRKKTVLEYRWGLN
jgi:hypothetical protein